MFLEVKFLPSQRLGDRKLSSLMVTLQGEGSQMLKKESCNLEKEALIFFFFTSQRGRDRVFKNTFLK